MADFDPTQGGGLIATIAATLASAFAGWRMLRSQNSTDTLNRASNEANILAIETYKTLTEELREQLATERTRADKFAEDKNEALKQLFTLQGKLDAMTEQMEAQAKELARLRDIVSKLPTQGN